MKVTIENTFHLTKAEKEQVENAVACIANQATSLEAARAWLRDIPNMFIHSGGSHLALHLSQKDTRRILIVTV